MVNLSNGCWQSREPKVGIRRVGVGKEGQSPEKRGVESGRTGGESREITKHHANLHDVSCPIPGALTLNPPTHPPHS